MREQNWSTPKKGILEFWNKNRKKNFLHIFGLFQLKKNRSTNAILISIFLNAQKKPY